MEGKNALMVDGTVKDRVDVERIALLCQKIMYNVGQVIIGKTEAVELLLVALLSEGHVLAEDAGVGRQFWHGLWRYLWDAVSAAFSVHLILAFRCNRCLSL